MDQNVNLDFTETGIDDVAGGMGPLIEAMEDLRDLHKDYLVAARSVTTAVNAEARAYDRLAVAAGKAAEALKSLPAGQYAGGYMSSMSRGSGTAITRSGGPMSALHSAQSRYNMAMKNGSVTDQFDAQIRLQRAQAAFQKAAASTQPASSGAGAGGSVGGFAMVAGAAAEGGPIAIAAAAIAAVLSSLAIAIKIGVERINTYTNALYAGGGSMAETAHGMRVGAGLGFDFGSRALAFGSQLNGGGPASFYARKYGINPIGNAMGQGDQDFTGKMVSALSTVLSKGVSDREAMLAARAWGMTDMLWARDASAGMKDKLFNHEARMYSQTERTASADTQIAYNIAMDDFKRIATEVAVHALPLATSGLIWFSKTLETIAEYLHWISPEEAKNWKAGNASASKSMEDGKKARDNMSRDRHADAMDRHSQALNGTYGGGPRARGAVPQGWGYQHFEDAARLQAGALGAFPL